MNALCTESLASAEQAVANAAIAIRTGRLVLKSPVDVDAKTLVALANNKAVAENLATMPYPYCEQDALDYFAGTADNRIGGMRFSVHLDIPGQKFIGVIGYGPMQEGADPEIGYWIGEPYWGFGYASEAAKAVVDYAFEEDDVTTLLGGARITNAASRRVLEKCGFEYQGYGKTYSRALDEEGPVDRFALTRPRYQGLKWRRRARV